MMLLFLSRSLPLFEFVYILFSLIWRINSLAVSLSLSFQPGNTSPTTETTGQMSGTAALSEASKQTAADQLFPEDTTLPIQEVQDLSVAMSLCGRICAFEFGLQSHLCDCSTHQCCSNQHKYMVRLQLSNFFV